LPVRILSRHGDRQRFQAIFTGDLKRPIVQNVLHKIPDLPQIGICKPGQKMVGKIPGTTVGAEEDGRSLL
jgi:hypothetical protein